MPIYLIIYSVHNHLSYGIKRIHYAIPTTFEDVQTEIDKHRDVLYSSNIYPHLQIEFVARDNTVFLDEIAKRFSKDDSSIKESEVACYNNWKDWE